MLALTDMVSNRNELLRLVSAKIMCWIMEIYSASKVALRYSRW